MARRSGSATPMAIDPIDARQHVVMAVLEIAADRLAIERVAVAGAAAIVGPQNRIAARGPGRLVIKEDRSPAESVGRFRPAVQLHDQRIARAGFVVDRIGQHALHADAVDALPLDAFLLRQREVAIEVVVDAGDARGRRADAGAQVQISPIRVGSSIMNTWRPAAVLHDGRHERVVALRDRPERVRGEIHLKQFEP